MLLRQRGERKCINIQNTRSHFQPKTFSKSLTERHLQDVKKGIGNIHIRDVPERAKCPPEKPAPSGKRIRRK